MQKANNEGAIENYVGLGKAGSYRAGTPGNVPMTSNGTANQRVETPVVETPECHL